MRRVFLDEDVEPKLEQALAGFEVDSIKKRRMQQITNGVLLRWLAQERFEVLITKEKGVPFQTSLEKTGIAVVVIRGDGPLAHRFIKHPTRLRVAVGNVEIGKWTSIEPPK